MRGLVVVLAALWISGCARPGEDRRERGVGFLDARGIATIASTTVDFVTAQSRAETILIRPPALGLDEDREDFAEPLAFCASEATSEVKPVESPAGGLVFAAEIDLGPCLVRAYSSAGRRVEIERASLRVRHQIGCTAAHDTLRMRGQSLNCMSSTLVRTERSLLANYAVEGEVVHREEHSLVEGGRDEPCLVESKIRYLRASYCTIHRATVDHRLGVAASERLELRDAVWRPGHSRFIKGRARIDAGVWQGSIDLGTGACRWSMRDAEFHSTYGGGAR